MVNVIGSIIIAGYAKNLIPHRLVFTESRIIAIPLSPKTYASEIGFQQVLESMSTIIMWEKVIEQLNKTQKSIVDYKNKTINEELFSNGKPNIPYASIKEVKIKRASWSFVPDEKVQYKITFVRGPFSDESFVIPVAALNEVSELIRKTPLSNKLKIYSK